MKTTVAATGDARTY